MHGSTENHAEVVIQECNELVIENRFGRKVLRWENDFENQGDYFDIVHSVLRFFKLYDLKARITTHSNIPVQAGLAGSTAILSSTLSAIAVFAGHRYNKYQLIEMNRIIELNNVEYVAATVE